MITVDSADNDELQSSAINSMLTNKFLKARSIETATKIIRWVLLLLLICDFSITIALIVQPLDDDQTTFEESEDLRMAIVRMATSSVTAALSLASLILLLPRFRWRAQMRMIILCVLRMISVIFLVAELAFPTPVRTALNATILCLIFVELLCIIFGLVKISKINKEYSIKKERGISISNALKSTTKNAEQFMELLDDWLLLRASRKLVHKKYVIGRNTVGTIAGVVFIIVITIFVAEFSKIASTQPTLYSESLLRDMNAPSKLSYYNSTIHTQPHNKVLVVVLDGLRYDYTNINNAMREFLNSPSVMPHSKLLKVRAQLPSMSVPNWMTILTGAPPESTGVLGNLLTPETNFDSIFREASNFGLQRGLTGSPWFSGIIKSTLPFLGGDGTIATTLGGRGDSSDTADYARAEVMKQALTSPLDYRLFLAHYSDIDIQGHCCGVDKEWNVEDSYQGAVTNKTKILSDLVQWIDNDTVVFVIADHGHVMRGGHGGIDPKLTEIPLIIYKKDSNFRNRSFTGPRFEEYMSSEIPHHEVLQLYNNTDLAPTVCAILGIPVPRQNQGHFIDDAMLFVNNPELKRVYYDLYMQKMELVQAFIQTTAPSNPPQFRKLAPDADIATYVSAVRELIDIRDNILRDQAISTQRARNIVVSCIIALMVLVCFCFLMQVVTMCDILSIFTSKSPVSLANRKASLVAFLIVLVYHGLNIAIYNICFAVAGYSGWDSTVIHTPEVLPRYAFICLIPAVVIIYIAIRAFHTYYSIRPAFSWQRFGEILDVWLLGKEAKFSDLGIVYLFRYYLVFWTVVSWLALLVIQSNYTFVVAPVFQVKFITPFLWQLRFRIITVQFMSLPLSVASFILLFIGYPSDDLKHGLFDSIYMLKIYKDVYRSTSSSIVTDEVLSKLANSVFYGALWKEVQLKRFFQVKEINDVALMGIDPSEGETNI